MHSYKIFVSLTSLVVASVLDLLLSVVRDVVASLRSSAGFSETQDIGSALESGTSTFLVKAELYVFLFAQLEASSVAEL